MSFSQFPIPALWLLCPSGRGLAGTFSFRGANIEHLSIAAKEMPIFFCCIFRRGCFFNFFYLFAKLSGSGAVFPFNAS